MLHQTDQEIQHWETKKKSFQQEVLEQLKDSNHHLKEACIAFVETSRSTTQLLERLVGVMEKKCDFLSLFFFN